MNDFFNSKFLKDLEDGKFPPVEVIIPVNTLYQIGAIFFFTGLALIISFKISQHV